MSNIEEYIEEIKTFAEYSQEVLNDMEYEKPVDVTITQKEVNAINNLLSERKQDKARIKELEEELYSANKIINEYLDDIPKQREKEMQAKIKELEEKNRMLALEGSRVRLDLYIKENYIPKQKVKDILNEIQEEYNKVQEQFDCIWNKKSKDNYDRYKLQELSAIQQELGFILGNLEELLEEGE